MPSVGLLAAKRTMELSWEGQVASPVPVEAYLQESGRRPTGFATRYPSMLDIPSQSFIKAIR